MRPGAVDGGGTATAAANYSGMRARLLRSLIAEKVSACPRPSEDWTVARCSHCGEEIWLSSGSLALLAADAAATAACLDCACALIDDPAY